MNNKSTSKLCFSLVENCLDREVLFAISACLLHFSRFGFDAFRGCMVFVVGEVTGNNYQFVLVVYLLSDAQHFVSFYYDIIG